MKIGKTSNPLSISGNDSPKKTAVLPKSTMGSDVILKNSIKTEILKELDILSRSLKEPALFRKCSLRTVLPPLNEILSLLGKSSLDLFDSDVILMEKFIDSWLGKYNRLLPGSQKKDLKILKNLLNSRRLDCNGGDSESILLYSSGENKENSIRWRAHFQKEKYTGPDDNQGEKIFCVLDLSCIYLGNIRVSLSEDEKRFICLFSPDRQDTGKKITISLPSFRNHLIESGLEPPFFKISRKKRVTAENPGEPGRGVELWG